MVRIIFVLFILIFFWINNLFIPLVLFNREYGLFERRYKGTGGFNLWSFIMDGFLVGMMNLTVTVYILSIGYSISRTEAVPAFFLGVIITTVTHIVMSIRNWQIWIMPKPWGWNLGGYWHMISMTLQFWLYALVFMILYNNRLLLFDARSQVMMVVFAVLGVLFMVVFFYKDKDLKIGKFHLSRESW